MFITDSWTGTRNTERSILFAGPGPHELLADTLIFPLTELAVALMEVEEELPLQPDGKFQVYEVAPDTKEML